jgi:parallel beta-helix repeat protein
MGVFESRHIRVLRNSLRHNPGPGIHAGDSNHISINGNQFSRSSPAIFLEADRSEVRRNRVSRNGNGIAISGNRNLIRGNRVDSTRGAEGGFGIPLEQGDHNRIGRNSIRDSQASAISVGFEPGSGNVVRRNHIRGAGETGVLVDSKGRHTVLRRNVVRSAAEDGVLVESRAKHTLLRRNHSFGEKDDGIDIDSSTTKLTRNKALRNAELGIEAVRGVIDGGGNLARHNGDPRQCTQVACK